MNAIRRKLLLVAAALGIGLVSCVSSAQAAPWRHYHRHWYHRPYYGYYYGAAPYSWSPYYYSYNYAPYGYAYGYSPYYYGYGYPGYYGSGPYVYGRVGQHAHFGFGWY